MILLIIIVLILIILLKNKKESFTSKLIPDVIHKIYIIENNDVIPSNIQNAINTWKDLNPGYTLKIWYHNDCLNYLKKYFTEAHVNCFNGFIPYAYKADFFRYCVIYNEGGWYTDIQQVLLVPLNVINDKNYEWVSCYDETGTENKVKRCMQNSFFGATKGNILLKKTIDLCIENYNTNNYTSSPWEITGPCLLGNIFKTINVNNKNIGFTFNDPKDGPCFNINGKKVIINKCCSSKNVPGTSFKNGNNYLTLWKNKKIFNHKI
jgi:mannosyltransferase OCH1-like enzyme